MPIDAFIPSEESATKRFLLVVMAGSMLLAMIACGDENEEAVLETATPGAITDAQEAPTDAIETLTAWPTQSPEPDVDLPGAEEVWLVLIRDDPDPDAPTAGSIWVSDGEGGNQKQVTPPGVRATYAGVVSSKTDGTLLYYTAIDTETTRTLFSVDIDSGTSTAILTYEDKIKFFGGAVSPDGRYVPHTQSDGLYLLDQSTGRNDLILEHGNDAECRAGDLGECDSVVPMQWSSDGRLLLIDQGVYEGSWPEVMDMRAAPPTILNPGNRDYPSAGRLSPAGSGVCGHGAYGGLTGLFLMEQPDYGSRELFSAPTGGGPSPETRSVGDCDWSSEDEIVYLSFRDAGGGSGAINAYSRQASAYRTVAEVPGAPDCCTGNIEAVPDTRLAFFQYLVSEDQRTYWSKPVALDLETAAQSTLLQDGDFVVDAFLR